MNKNWNSLLVDGVDSDGGGGDVDEILSYINSGAVKFLSVGI